MRKVLSIIAAGSLALALAACGGDDSGSGDGGDAGTVGVAMPTKSSERWIADGNNIKEQLEAAGYSVDLQVGTEGHLYLYESGGDGKYVLSSFHAMDLGDEKLDLSFQE